MSTDPNLPGVLEEASGRVGALIPPLVETSVALSMARIGVMWSWQGTQSHRDQLQSEEALRRIKEAVSALQTLAQRLDASRAEVELHLREEAAARAAAAAAAEKAAAAKAAAEKAKAQTKP